MVAKLISTGNVKGRKDNSRKAARRWNRADYARSWRQRLRVATVNTRRQEGLSYRYEVTQQFSTSAKGDQGHRST
jgi:hypothetical protein